MNKNLKNSKAVMVCKDVLHEGLAEYYSNCGGDWSITCKKHMNYEEDAQTVSLVHFHHLMEQYPSVLDIKKLPINSCKYKNNDGDWEYEYEAYDYEGTVSKRHCSSEEDIYCLHEDITRKLLSDTPDAHFFYFEHESKIAFFKFKNGLISPALYSTREKAEEMKRHFPKYKISKVPLSEIRLKLKSDFDFFSLDFINQNKIEVHLIEELFLFCEYHRG